MLGKATWGIVFIMASDMLCAQTTAQLSGQVKDAITDAPLIGARIEVLVGDSVISSTSGEQGAYRFVDLPTGIQRVQVTHTGYSKLFVPEVWLRSGKEEVLDLLLERAASEMAEAIVEGTTSYMSPLSSYTLAVEQSLRYPATFFDPARLASTLPGVVNTNDQANHISIRGNGPASNAYLLEGAEIVNPNHLTNAGTASDLPSLSGGGVSVLSAQMLATSRLYTGGFPTAYGNATGGVMDMHLRRGNSEKHGYTIQAGLLGIDLSAEGPFRKGGKSSYLINYRYSTLGLLSAIGVDLGDERITFQDISFHANMPFRSGAFSVFGFRGSSSNRFTAKDTADWVFDKDSQDIDYDAQVGAVGADLRTSLGANAVLHITGVVSQNDQDRVETGPFDSQFAYTDRKYLSERKIALVTYVSGSLGARFNYRIGGNAMERMITKELGISETITGWLVRPYAQFDYAITEKFRAETGLAYSHFTYNSASVVEPRIAFRWLMRKGRSMSLSVGQRGQLPNVQLYQIDPYQNANIGFSRLQEVVLAFDHPFKPHLVMHAEVYLQQQTQVATGVIDPTGVSAYSNASMINAWDNYYYWQLAPGGEAMSKGLELGLRHSMYSNFFYQLNATYMDATWKDLDGREMQSRWNNTVAGNVIVGREFVKQKETVKRTWGVNGRLSGTGGQRYTPINAPEGTKPFSAQYDPFFRADLRIYVRREHKGRTGMWALDLQNVSNQKNVAYQYFDHRKNEVITKYQLGIIPNISYRIEF